MRRLGDVRVADRGSGIATTWVGPRRVLAVVVTPGCCGAGDTIVSGVDTGRRRVVWRRTLGGSLQAGERWRRGLLLVLGPRRRSVGPSRLVWIGPRGGTRSTSVPEIRSGNAPDGSVTQSWNPGLAVDRRGARAFVVQANAPLAEVDLRTFGVRSHPLERPARAADSVVGPTRHAVWLGREMVAITGFDSHSSRRPPGWAHDRRHTQLAQSRDRPAHDRRCARFRHTARLVVPRHAEFRKRTHRLFAPRSAEMASLRQQSDLGRATDRSERAGGRTIHDRAHRSRHRSAAAALPALHHQRARGRRAVSLLRRAQRWGSVMERHPARR